MPRPVRDEMGFKYGCGLSLGLTSSITSSQPGHTGVSLHAHALRDLEPPAGERLCTPLVGASALHGVSGFSSGSHLGSTLRPGGAVLTRGVSRRSGSVAYIHADASPTEVLARPSWHRKRYRSNTIGRIFTASRASVQFRTAARCRSRTIGSGHCARGRLGFTYGHHIAGPPSRSRPRQDVRGDEGTDTEVARDARRDVEIEDRTRARRLDEHFLHPDNTGGRAAAVLVGTGDSSCDHCGIRYVLWYFGAASGVSGARQR